MEGLLVILSTVALASCSPAPTFGALGLLGGHHGGHAVGLPGIVGGGVGGLHGAGAHGLPGVLHHGGGASLPGAVLGGAAGGLPGAIVGSALAGAPGGFSGSLGGLASGIFGGVRPGGRTDRGYMQEGGVYPVGGGGLFQALGFLAQGLTDVVGNAGSILDDVIHLRIPAVLDDGFNAVISTGRGLGGIINALIPGLGSLLGNLVVSIGKILICLLGSPGLTGSLLGRIPGKDNPRDIPYICTPSYGRDWGCSYDGAYDYPNSILNFYKVKDAKRQALEFINKYTNGRGIDSLTGSRRIVVDRIIIITDIVDKGANNWTDDDIANLVINIIIINGAIGNSYQPGLGPQIVDEWIVTLKKNNKNKRFPDLTKYRSEIILALKGATEDKWAGAFDQSKRKDWERIRRSDNDETSNQSNSNDQSNESNSGSESDAQQQQNSNSSNSNKSEEESNQNSNSGSNKTERESDQSNRSDNEGSSSNEDSSSSNQANNQNSNSGNNKSDREGNQSNSSDNQGSSSNEESSSSNQANNGSNKSGSGSKQTSDNEANSSGSDNNASDDSDASSTFLNEKNASSKLNKASEENSHSKSSTGSGKSQTNADGSSSSEYNFANNEASSSKKDSESIDNRSNERTYKRVGDDDD